MNPLKIMIESTLGKEDYFEEQERMMDLWTDIDIHIERQTTLHEKIEAGREGVNQMIDKRGMAEDEATVQELKELLKKVSQLIPNLNEYIQQLQDIIQKSK